MTNDCDVLTRAIRSAQQAWEQQKRGKTLLTQGPPDRNILDQLSAAIEQCEAYKSVSGHVLFTANSGVILDASTLALPLLYRGEWAIREGQELERASEWLIRLLGTRQADAVFKAAIWGLSFDEEIVLADGSYLMPFDQFPACPMKRRIVERARKSWDNSVWLAQNFFEVPRAAYLKKVAGFPYIRTDNAPFAAITQLEEEAYELLMFLEAKIAGRPLVLGYWFEYDDQDLDLNAFENYISWLLPEIVPRIPTCVTADSYTLSRDHHAFLALPADWRNDVKRSMERFTLSQCRRQIIDRVLDLTLAFEIAVSGKGDNAPPSWKVSVRSAQMIGGKLKDRQERRRKIAALYSLRNKGTHGSSLNSIEPAKQEKTLKDAMDIYGELMTSFLSLSGPPDWSSIELQPTTAD